MFFYLTNLPATFQAMMNKLLRDLINMGKIESFIDYVMVKIESKKGHNELVEKILRRTEENYLYIKLEKYKWKVREIDFLEKVCERFCKNSKAITQVDKERTEIVVRDKARKVV